MDYQALKTLIDSDPANAAKSDEDVVSWCNTASVVRDRATVPSTEVFTECLRESAEWGALTADARQEVRDILTVWDDIPTVSGSPARTRLIALLGTNTKAAIAAIIPETVSPAVDADLGTVYLGDVQNARAL